MEASGLAERMFSTFGGNPVAARAALAVLDVIDDERIIPHTKRIEQLLREGLERLRRDHPPIVDVRGLGLLIGVELDGPERTNAAMNAMMKQPALQEAWAKQGAVPMIMTPAEFEALLRKDIEKWATVVKTANIKAQ